MCELRTGWRSHAHKDIAMHTGHTDRDESAQVLHAARAMIRRYGEHAHHEAAMRVKELSDCGDPEGAKLWGRVVAELLVRIPEEPRFSQTNH